MTANVLRGGVHRHVRTEVQRPLASVVIGGITTSTLLTLIVLPTLYELIEAWVLRRREED